MAAFTFLIAVHVWWNAFTPLQEATVENVLSLLVTVLLLYLSCAFALLDSDWEQPRTAPGGGDGENGEREPLDPKAFYSSGAHRRWYFGVVLAGIVTAEGLFPVIQILEGRRTSPRSLLLSRMLGAVLVLLILTDRDGCTRPSRCCHFYLRRWLPSKRFCCSGGKSRASTTFTSVRRGWAQASPPTHAEGPRNESKEDARVRPRRYS